MASFSLELDGDRVQTKSFSDDPFENANVIPPTSTEYLENVSDISDEDFDIPCSQKRLSSRLVFITLYFIDIIKFILQINYILVMVYISVI